MSRHVGRKGYLQSMLFLGRFQKVYHAKPPTVNILSHYRVTSTLKHLGVVSLSLDQLSKRKFDWLWLVVCFGNWIKKKAYFWLHWIWTNQEQQMKEWRVTTIWSLSLHNENHLPLHFLNSELHLSHSFNIVESSKRQPCWYLTPAHS